MPGLSPNIWVRRLPAVVAAVVLAHSLSWQGLKAWTASACLWAGGLVGLEGQSTSPTAFLLEGRNYYIGTSCTFVDVVLPALVLLWCSRLGPVRNLAVVLVASVGLFALNLARLTVGFWLHDQGVPWWLGHEVVAGFAYFVVLEFLILYRACLSKE